MVARGLSTLDELESAEREESAAVLDAQLSGAVDVADWGAALGAVPGLGQWADPGSSGGTLSASQGSGGS
ncbi:hypothetical protein N656DRAFT_781348 [Canariomyces notabilis]|uniref:Uncharacterized protein n=1 Tax=Canariomyces notabilis TaxID=2074819 RepID=A0AAN6QPD8_9PEZI|nr:hypothetical protein N656DRAFT_781348 [Canariomyces arenarius]